MYEGIHKTARKYPARLRRSRYRDPETLIFLTNNFELPSRTITDLYRRRWQIELFFKWIEQHLRIRSFCGDTENAVKTGPGSPSAAGLGMGPGGAWRSRRVGVAQAMGNCALVHNLVQGRLFGPG